jgi:hypothetical protein
MPPRAIRSLPSHLSCPGSPPVEIVSALTSSHELNSWSLVRCRMGAVRSRSGVAYLKPRPSDNVEEQFGPWRELTVEEVDLGAGESCSLEPRGPLRLTRRRVVRPSRADVTCSSIST